MRIKLVMLTICFVALVIQGCQKEGVNGSNSESTTESAERKAAVLEKNAAADGSKGLPSSFASISKTEAQAVDPVGQEPLNDAITCLSRTIYWEARGQGTASMEAVASVVMNRLGHVGFPDTICEVVRQGREEGACQFSWWCDGHSDNANEDDSYASSKEIARKALNQQLTDRTGGAMYFHQREASPSWSRQYIKTVEVGELFFYKPHDRAAQ
jgi:spore germination cell wall hydrolase CwlJ-like protein